MVESRVEDEMQARVQNRGDIFVVQLVGRVDVETAAPFRQACLSQLKGRKVVFDFKNLSFVGSSGLIPFFETMHEFGELNEHGLKFSAVGIDFKKLLLATPLARFEVTETEEQAVLSYQRPPPVAAAPAPTTVVEAVVAVSATEVQVAAGAAEPAKDVDLFQLVRASFEEKMRRPLDMGIIEKPENN